MKFSKFAENVNIGKQNPSLLKYAFQLFQDDLEKARLFVKNSLYLGDFGFHEEKISKALLDNNLQMEVALESLMNE